MRECHSCRTSLAIDALRARFSNPPEKAMAALREECLRCSREAAASHYDDAMPHGGMSFVSRDACARGSADAIDERCDFEAAGRRAPEPWESIDPPGPSADPSPSADAGPSGPVADELRAYCALSLPDKILVACLLHGMTLVDYAARGWNTPLLRRRISKQAAHTRFIRILRRMPHLASIGADAAAERSIARRRAARRRGRAPR